MVIESKISPKWKPSELASFERAYTHLEGIAPNIQEQCQLFNSTNKFGLFTDFSIQKGTWGTMTGVHPSTDQIRAAFALPDRPVALPCNPLTEKEQEILGQFVGVIGDRFNLKAWSPELHTTFYYREMLVRAGYTLKPKNLLNFT